MARPGFVIAAKADPSELCCLSLRFPQRTRPQRAAKPQPVRLELAYPAIYCQTDSRLHAFMTTLPVLAIVYGLVSPSGAFTTHDEVRRWWLQNYADEEYTM
jgi:hypothetical protein